MGLFDRFRRHKAGGPGGMRARLEGAMARRRLRGWNPPLENVNALVASGGPRLLARSRELVVTGVTDRAVFTAAIDEPRAADGWFAGGVLTWETGANAGRSIEVKAWSQAGSQVELFLPMGYAITAGDGFRVHPGCDKRLETCIDRFANVLNFRGEPYVPGQDSMMEYADAG